MRLGYNTNGLPHHATSDALEVLAEIGYRSVALTLDHHCLPPDSPTLGRDLEQVRTQLEHRKLDCVIETGARFLLDRFEKHAPTLMAASRPDQARRIAFYRHAIDVAARLGAPMVSLWSGIQRDEAPRSVALDRLVEGLLPVLDCAAQRGVVIAFEPEPGMFIETMEQFAELDQRVNHPAFQLTIDIGHLQCVESQPIAECLRAWGPRIRNIHIEDMRRGVHEHLMFGEGEIDFPPVIAALREIEYAGGLHVELSRHGHDGPAAAKRAFAFLSNLLPLDLRTSGDSAPEKSCATT
jgi:L-ribulose-5-phosphate 3-epimerase